MKKNLLPGILLLLITQTTNSQVLKGRITNSAGEPIPYATVYIQELRQGTTANTRGDYELRLSAGKYLITYQSLGFSPVFSTITMTGNDLVKNVTLQVQYYEIPEVRINASGEDPAYGIMRKAIGMAPYYLNNINYYKADVYLKGNLYINRIPRIMQKAINLEARNEQGGGVSSSKIKEGDVYIMESFNEIVFTAPDKYVQKVISVNSTFPDEGDNVSPMDLIQASFYEPVIADMAISPLSPQAFSYYNFKYLGASMQGNFVVSKIEVEPKRKSQQLFEGIIYIIEELWCLHSVDLTNDNLAGTIRVEQLYIPVEEDIWLPVSHKFRMDVNIFGFKAEAGYGSSVKYLDVQPNLQLRKPETLNQALVSKPADPVLEKPVTKNQQKIEELLEKDELSNRDMVKLARMMDKESEESKPDSVKKNLEITSNTTHTIAEDATKKDSAFWASIRPIPLSDPELQSIRLRDSLKSAAGLQQIKLDSASTEGLKQKNKFVSGARDLAFGRTWSSKNGISFTHGGLVDINNLSFNTVDGFIYGIDFRFSKKWKDAGTLALFPDLKWAFSREQLMWRLSGSYNFSKLKLRTLSFRTGITSRDISSGGSINNLINSFTSLFLKDNYLRLYESRYLFAGSNFELANGLYLGVTAGYEYRNMLDNTTNFSFSKSERDYAPNLPENEYLAAGANPIYSLRDQEHYEIVTNVTFTPRQRYTINNNVKIARGSDWPTFGLTWRHGINEYEEYSDPLKHYDMIRFQASKTHEPGAFSEFRWMLRAGGFLNNTWINYYDFFHFNSQPLPVLIDNYEDAFRLAPYYSLSTPEFFGEAHIRYTTPYLLLKYLPGLSKTLIRENVTVAVLGSRYHQVYTELGYYLSEIYFIGEFGVFAGFDDLKFRSAGIRLVLKLN
jgi:hypothetical protein